MKQELDSDFLPELAKACIINAEIMSVVKPHFNYSFISSKNGPYKEVFKYIFDHFGATQKPPTIGLLAQNVTMKEALPIIAKIRDINIFDSKEQIIDTFEVFIKRGKFMALYKKLEEIFNNGEYDKAYKIMEVESAEINAFSLKKQMHSRVFANFDDRQKKRQEKEHLPSRKVPTGLPAFDYHTRGGIDRGTGILGIARSGVGKAQPLYSRVYTPFGFKLMGDIKSGDIVLSEKGLPISVVDVFPQGKRSVYRVNFSDGAFVDCDKDHLWKVYSANDRKKVSNSKIYKKTSVDSDKHSILTTFEMIGKERIYQCAGRENVLNYKIPICQPLQFVKRDLKIKPYALGVLIGDGNFDKTSVKLSTKDDAIIDRVVTELDAKCKHIGGCDYRLSGFNGPKLVREIFGRPVKFFEKFIPNDYLFSSIEDRVDLLRGLMDTDGYVNKKGTSCIFYTSSGQLANDVRELVNSLGGIAIIKNRGKKGYTYKGEKKISKFDSYSVNINISINPFFLNRKAKLVKLKSRYETPRFIESITYLGEHETQCILVDSKEHLYVTDHCVVTHNTTFLRSLGGHAAFRGINVVHFAAGDSTQEEVEDGYDAWWTGLNLNDLKEGKMTGPELSKIEKAKKAWLSQCGEIHIKVFKQFNSASIADCRNFLMELLKEHDIGLVLFDYLEKFDPGDGKRYGTNDEGNRARKLATAEKIINIATEFNLAVATVTQAADIDKEKWDNPNFVITRSNIANLRATIDPFAYCVTLNQTQDENDAEIMRIHEEKLRHYKILSYQSTYHIAQKRDVGRFIDVAETKRRFWNDETKQIVKFVQKSAA